LYLGEFNVVGTPICVSVVNCADWLMTWVATNPLTHEGTEWHEYNFDDTSRKGNRQTTEAGVESIRIFAHLMCGENHPKNGK